MQGGLNLERKLAFLGVPLSGSGHPLVLLATLRGIAATPHAT
jgi:hypothetical protein